MKRGRPDILKKVGKEKFFKMLYQVQYGKPTKTLSYRQMAKRLGISEASLSRFLKDTFPRKYGDEYNEWIEMTMKGKYFYRWEDGKLITPYDEVELVYDKYKMGRITLKTLNNYLRMGAEFWEYCGHKAPSMWEHKELIDFIYSKPESVRFSYSVALRQFLPNKNILPTFKKTEARVIPEIASKDFPLKFKELVKWAKALASNKEEAEEIEFIIMTKAFTGIRTGKRTNRKELWGTKYSDETGINTTWVRIIDDRIYWNVYAKKDEHWIIKTETIPTYVDLLIRERLKKLEKGDWVVSISTSRAISLLKRACEKVGIPRLNLHDLRKVYVSFLVRSGIPLEVAVSINVGWKDLNTAYKHYLMFGAGILERYKSEFSEFSGYASL